MPELPEVETVRTGLDKSLRGAVIGRVQLRRKDLRTPFPGGFAQTLAGRTISRIERRAKYLLFYLDSGDVMIAHLGMSGRFSVCHPAFIAGSPQKLHEMPQQVRHDNNKHDHVIFTLKDGRKLIYNDARRFGLMDLARKSGLAKHRLFAHLGPEPLEKEFSAAYLKQALEARKTPVKVAIMDQALVVGVGNIYASEALFLSRIHPKTPAHKAAKHAALLVKSIRSVLGDAIRSGGSSLRDFLHISGEAGYFQHHFNVYGRAGKPCLQCQTPIKTLKQGGRSTFFCPKCQK